MCATERFPLIRFQAIVIAVAFGAALAGCGGTVASSSPDAGAPDAGCACPAWTVRCGDSCVDLTANPLHCAACFVACDSKKEICNGGVCAPAARCGAVAGTGDDGGVPLPDGGVPPAGLRGEYYAGTDLTGLKLVRTDAMIDFDWSQNGPDPAVGQTSFSVRWTGQLTVPATDKYTFYTTSDDGVRLWIDDQLLVDDWTNHGPTEDSGAVSLSAGQRHAVRLEYFQGGSGAVIKWEWSSATEMRAVVPASALTPSTGELFACAGGSCCASGGPAPICCPSGTRCVQNANFAGCCPNGNACGEPRCHD